MIKKSNVSFYLLIMKACYNLIYLKRRLWQLEYLDEECGLLLGI